MGRPYVPVRQDARKMRYIEWLTTPPQLRDPKTEDALAKELDVYGKTLYNWRQDREFRDVWRDDADEVIGGEDKRQRVMETLYMAAIDYHSPRHVAAAKLYLDAIGAMRPGQIANIDGPQPKAIGLLTQEELDSMIRREVAGARAAQRNGDEPAE